MRRMITFLSAWEHHRSKSRAERGRDIFIAWCLLLWASTPPVFGQASRPITEAATVLAVYTEDWQLQSSEPVKIVVVAWGDGRIVWSEDRRHGGPPYRAAQIDASRLKDLLSRYEEDGLFEIEALTRAHLGPDSAFTTMVLRVNGEQIRLRSWHELMESGGRSVAREVGVVSDSRPRLQVLQDESSDYLFYRFVWAEIRARALELIPPGGGGVDGEVIVEQGNVSWDEADETRD